MYNQFSRYFSIAALAFFLISCDTSTSQNDGDAPMDSTTRVEMVTDLGTIVLKLYDKTPKHRDNFIALVEKGAYDSLLFHRVIETFMIQGGDPQSKTAAAGDTLGNGGVGYRVPAEFDTTLFHKRGALAAARDNNAERASSGIQFYIVQGRAMSDSLLDIAEGRINGWLAEHYNLNDPANEPLADSLKQAIDNEDWETAQQISMTLRQMAKTYDDFDRYAIPEAHREVYRSIGGAPHLDQNYTVFGEVLEGMAIVDSIAAVMVDPLNRPLEDVRIRSVRILQP